MFFNLTKETIKDFKKYQNFDDYSQSSVETFKKKKTEFQKKKFKF